MPFLLSIKNKNKKYVDGHLKCQTIQMFLPVVIPFCMFAMLLFIYFILLFAKLSTEGSQTF